MIPCHGEPGENLLERGEGSSCEAAPDGRQREAYSLYVERAVEGAVPPQMGPSHRSGRSHRRTGEAAAERHETVGGARDVEVEREVLVDGEHVAQVPLERIAGVDAVGAVAGPGRLDRLRRQPGARGGRDALV